MSEKADAEIGYWKKRFDLEGGRLQNSWYQKLMCCISGKDKAWFSGKVVCDFGSGPRGSLEWLNNASKVICADVLVQAYGDLGIREHNAIYIETTEDRIPLLSEYCDVVFTINSIDHVDNLETMCRELLRITKRGGYLAGSVNLNEPPTPAEPQTITKEIFDKCLGSKLCLERVLVAPRYPGAGQNYKHLYDYCETGKELPPVGSQVGYLWFFGKKERVE